MVLNHTLQRHNFDNENDEDWVKFYAIRDARYTIKACDLTIVCNVGVTLHDAAGKEVPAPACEGDPGEDEWICKQDGEPGEDEWIDWTCRQEGVYYVRVKNENKNFGENTSYSLMVYQPTAPSLSVRVHGVVKDCNTGKPIEDVVIKTDQGISAMSGNKGSYIMPHMEWDNVTFTVQRERYSTCTCPKISVQDGLTVNFQLSASGEPKCPECCTAYVDTSKSTSRNGGGGGGGSGVG